MKNRVIALGLLLEILYLGFYIIKFLQQRLGVENLFLDHPLIFSLTFIVLGLALIVQIATYNFLTNTKVSYKYILIFSVIFNFSLLFVYNLGSNDLYTHIQRGRMVANYNVSPYNHIYDEFKYDEFYETTKTVWSGQLSIYGPAFTIFGSLISFLARDSLMTHIIIYKFIYSLLNILSGLVIYKITKSTTSAMLFSWNPAVIFEVQANNHFEILTVFPMLLALYFLITKVHWKHYVIGLSLLTISVLTKYVSVIIYPLFLLYAFRSLKTNASKVKFIMLGGLVQLAIILVSLAPFLESGINTKGFFELANANFISPSIAILLLFNFFEKFNLDKTLAQPIMQNLFKLEVIVIGLLAIFSKKFLEQMTFVKTLVLVFAGFTLIYLNLILPWYTMSLLALICVAFGLIKSSKYAYFSFLLTLYSFVLYIRVK